jgi:hypothetical protein
VDASVLLRQSLSQYLGTAEVEEDTPLMDAGLNSNSAVALRQALADKLQLPRLSRTLIFDYPSIAAISDHIKTQSSDQSISSPCISQSAQDSAATSESPECASGRSCPRTSIGSTKANLVQADVSLESPIPEGELLADGPICCGGEAYKFPSDLQSCVPHTCKAPAAVNLGRHWVSARPDQFLAEGASSLV